MGKKKRLQKLRALPSESLSWQTSSHVALFKFPFRKRASIMPLTDVFLISGIFANRRINPPWHYSASLTYLICFWFKSEYFSRYPPKMLWVAEYVVLCHPWHPTTHRARRIAEIINLTNARGVICPQSKGGQSSVLLYTDCSKAYNE